MLYIRTDANEKIGMGHLMRCLSIADAARDFGLEAVFIIADEASVSLLNERGYSFIILNSNYVDPESEIDKMLGLINERRIEHLLIDSYFVTEMYLKSLSSVTETAYIDDLNMFRYPVSTLICYEGYYNKYHYEENYRNTDIKLLLGLEYVPLRKEFSRIKKKDIKAVPEELLILSGGGDQSSILEKIMDAIEPDTYKRINIIGGLFNNKTDKLTEKVSRYDNIHILHNLSNIWDYMQSADIALTAAGTTMYELAVCGTPSISYVVADNQIDNASFFDETGMIDGLGDMRESGTSDKIKVLLKKYEAPEIRMDKSLLMQRTIDGLGAARIVKDGFSI